MKRGFPFTPEAEWELLSQIRHGTRHRGVIITGIGSLVVSGLMSVGATALPVATFNAVAAALTYGIGFGALAGASALLSGIAGGRSQQIRGPEAQKRTYELEDGPRIVVLGKARVGGVYALRVSKEFDTYRLLAQCEGPVDAIEEYYVGDRAVVVETDGSVSSPPFVQTSGSYLHLFSKLGTTDQTAFSQLTSAFPDDWTTDHRGRGVVHTLGKFTSPGTDDPLFLKIWPQGFPQIDCLVRGVKIYDPRKDSTVTGGSGSHRTDDPDTWEWSDNGVLCALWQCTASEDQGGCGLSFNDFDLEDIITRANQADETVDSKAGTGAERRSTCNGSYTTDTPRGDVLANILLSTGTRVVRLQNGKMSLWLDEDNPESTVTIERRHINQVTYGGDEIVTDVNQLNLLFVSPERNWQMAELAIGDKSWARDEDSITRTGKRTETLSLKFCSQPGQAQRIARRVFAKRRSQRGEVVTNLSGLIALGHIAGTVEMDVMEPGWAPVVEFGSARVNEDRVTVTLPTIFIPTLAEWSVDDDEVDPPVALADVQFSGDLPAPVASRVVLAEVSSGVNELRFLYEEVADADAYEATYRTWDGSSAGARVGMTEMESLISGSTYAYWAKTGTGILEGDRYLLQVRASTSEGDVSNWSTAIEHDGQFDETAPDPADCIATASPGGEASSPTVTARCNDINISRIKIGSETPFYADPFTAYTFVRTYGTIPNVTFYNSTGQSTVVTISY